MSVSVNNKFTNFQVEVKIVTNPSNFPMARSDFAFLGFQCWELLFNFCLILIKFFSF